MKLLILSISYIAHYRHYRLSSINFGGVILGFILGFIHHNIIGVMWHMIIEA